MDSSPSCSPSSEYELEIPPSGGGASGCLDAAVGGIVAAALRRAETVAAAEMKRLEDEGNFWGVIEAANRFSEVANAPVAPWDLGERLRRGTKAHEGLHRHKRQLWRRPRTARRPGLNPPHRPIRKTPSSCQAPRCLPAYPRTRGHAPRSGSNARRHGGRRNATRGSPSDPDPESESIAASAAFEEKEAAQ
jgi:hypothetical protein